MNTAKLFIAMHKPYPFPNDSLYIPIQVGSINKQTFGIIQDCTGFSISEKNPYYCELTAVYWVWKNNVVCDADYVGLVHYRRFFRGLLLFSNKRILSEKEITRVFTKYDVILPKKRNYLIESVEQHYSHAHYATDLQIVKEIINKLYPEYNLSLQKILKRKTLYRFNMFVMRKADFENYMNWLFSILTYAEKSIPYYQYDSYQKRVFGFLAERLLNVWIDKQQLKIFESSIVNCEREHIIRKGFDLIKRKMFPKG